MKQRESKAAVRNSARGSQAGKPDVQRQSGWMSPLEINEQSDLVGADASPCGRRASLKGFLSMPLTKYLESLDWTRRQLRAGKRGTIPAELAPILERFGLDTAGWCDLVQKFGKLFKREFGVKSGSSQAGLLASSWCEAVVGRCWLIEIAAGSFD